ncbi:hypothetical protein HUJ05_007771 [Dendroctonus ponderosae]|nr:hypothetical protein HUJ05_007771 [Dendroctonus ponderosae]
MLNKVRNRFAENLCACMEVRREQFKALPRTKLTGHSNKVGRQKQDKGDMMPARNTLSGNKDTRENTKIPESYQLERQHQIQRKSIKKPLTNMSITMQFRLIASVISKMGKSINDRCHFGPFRNRQVTVCKLGYFRKTALASTLNLSSSAKPISILLKHACCFLTDAPLRCAFLDLLSSKHHKGKEDNFCNTENHQHQTIEIVTERILRTKKIARHPLKDRPINTGITERCQIEDIVRWIRKRRREWSRHVNRMSLDRIVKIVRNNGRRPVERPPKRWKNSRQST